MAIKDPVHYEWEKTKTTRVNLKILNEKGIIQALDAFIKKEGGSRNGVCIKALTQFLVEHDYNPQNYKNVSAKTSEELEPLVPAMARRN